MRDLIKSLRPAMQDHPPLKMKLDGVLVKLISLDRYISSLVLDPYPINCIILGPGEMKFMGSGSLGRWEMKQMGPIVTPSSMEGDSPTSLTG